MTTDNNPAILQRISDAEKRLEENGLIFDKYGQAPWSASKLKSLEKCPYQYYLKYILKVKPDDDFVRDTAMADIGTTAHRILEHIVLGKSVSEAYALTKREHCNLPPGSKAANLTEEQWQDSILTLEGNIIAFKEKLDNFEKNHKVKRILTELRVGVTKDWEPTTFFGDNVYFRGVIDLVMQIETEPGKPCDILILDHKHGGGEFGGIKNYETQLDIYKPLFHHGVAEVAGGQAGIHFIKAGRTVIGDYTDAEYIEDKLVAKLEWFIEGAIEASKTNGFFKHVRGNHCKYCEYDRECKAGQLKANELTTKKYFEIKEIKQSPQEPKAPWDE